MPLADFVDLNRFMGTWYVHGYTPTPIDGNAFNPTETYERGENGRIETSYRFNDGSLDGTTKEYNPTGRVFDETTNAEWRMTFFGIITSPYLILYVNDDYTQTVIGHPDRDKAWIMTRDPQIDESTYTALRGELERRNFDLSELQRAEHNQRN
ncbi:lipocalin family protein [Actomonas aquatica]|uniref:Lipocalin family protein n=1 Tax=Actomonas aquatica TaxID=2866162 RepID=A0ABZ1CE96_9BACT|nr:lipocalin family protein [Opitutus sp. WL0086]WRQ89617.1 lipocalin family protein [Opitutus sp. WL0086]